MDRNVRIFVLRDSNIWSRLRIKETKGELAMEQNLSFGKRYSAFDLRWLFHFDSTYEFLFIFDDDADDGYFFFFKPGEIFDFKKIETSETPVKDNIYSHSFREKIEPILQQYQIEYKLADPVVVHEKLSFFINDNGYILWICPEYTPHIQSWACGFAPGFKTVGGKYELNKIKMTDEHKHYFQYFNSMYISPSKVEEFNKVILSYFELFAKQLLAENADISEESFVELFLFLERNFDAVMVCGADGYRLYMQPEYDYSRLAPKGVKETVFRNGIGLTGDVNLNIVVLEEQKDKSICEKSYTFLWENSDDIKSYLLGYIRSDTREKQKNYIAKNIMLGRAYELPLQAEESNL